MEIFKPPLCCQHYRVIDTYVPSIIVFRIRIDLDGYRAIIDDVEPERFFNSLRSMSLTCVSEFNVDERFCAVQD